MWVCEQCGCQGIAADLARCPQCGEERGMPKANSGGASNAWEQQPEQQQTSAGEAGDPAGARVPAPAEAEGDAPAQADDSPEAAAAPADVTPPEGWTEVSPAAPAPDYASMSKADLTAEAAARELPVSGTKADLAARLADHDAANTPAEGS